MSLRDRLVDLDSRLLRVPRNGDEAFHQSVRYWWVGLVGAVLLVVAGSVLSTFVRPSVGFTLFAPPLAFASGYYYAHRLLARGERSAWLDHRSDPEPQAAHRGADDPQQRG